MEVWSRAFGRQGGGKAVNDASPEPSGAALPVGAGVIRAKILPRRLPDGMIERPSLMAQLDSGRRSTLTLLSAPAGYGKTTLLTGWLAGSTTVRSAWVSLDSADQDPVRLWTHIIVALHAVETRAGARSLAGLRSRPNDIAGHALPILLEELSGDGPDLVLILDDYHLAENRGTDATIRSFLKYRPERLQVVVASRYDPNIGIARLRASAELLEIRAADLAFDDRELQEFLAAAGVVGLSNEEAGLLCEQTGGWPAPLRLMALLLEGQDPHTLVTSFQGTRRPVADYLTTDVLDLLDPRTRDFVLRVSILTRMCGPLCDAVVGAPVGGDTLIELERANLLVSADTEGVWFTQHHLFAETMRLELARTRPDLVPTLHRRAAEWFEQAGDLEAAAAHAIAARDVPLASRLVASQVEALGAHGRWATMRGWLSQLSWPAAMNDPELAFVRAVADFFSHDIEGAEGWLEVAGTGPADLVGALGVPLGFRTALFRSFVGVNDLARAEQEALEALQSAPAPMWEGVALAGLGQAQHLRGATAEARESLLRATSLIPDGAPNLLAFAIGNLALAEFADGATGRSAVMLEPAFEMMRTAGQLGSPVGAILFMGLGERLRAEGDPRAAAGWFEVAVETLGPGTRSGWLANAYLLHAAALHALGDGTGAIRSLDAADAILDRLADPGRLPSRSRRLRGQTSGALRPVTEFGEELSDREVVVLELAGRGLTQQDIADQLFISYNTVKTHLRSAYRKLGVGSRKDALARLADIAPDPSVRP